MKLNAGMSGLVFSEKILEKIETKKIDDRKVEYYNFLLKKLESTEKKNSDIKEFIISFFANVLDWQKDKFVKDIPDSEKVVFEEAMQHEKPHLMYVTDNKDKFYFYIVPSDKKIDDRDDKSGRLKISYFGKFERILRGKNVKYGFITNGEILRFVYAESGLITSYIEWDVNDFREIENLETFYNLFNKDKIHKHDKNSLYNIIKQSQEEQGEITFSLSRQVLDALKIMVEKINESEESIDEEPQKVYENIIKAVMRMIFLLFAEENGIFPHGDPIYDENYGIIFLSNRLLHDEKIEAENLKEMYDAWPRLLALFNLVYYGSNHPALPIVAHGGDLFDPKTTEFLSKIEIDNYSLTQIFKKILYIDKHRVSYRVFSVEQIGYLYEGLLNFSIKKENGKYFLIESGDRKSSGSYYTPTQLVRYIVEKTLDNLVENKTSKEILSLKIVDPAMGSGAFLVQAVRYLAEHLAKAWQKEGKYEELNFEEKVKEAKRQIVELCIYGVDLNPMAVELAKVSLWLETLSSDKPFSFLDHHLKVGNSLLGVWNGDNIEEVKEEVFVFKKDLYSKEYIDKTNLLKKQNKKFKDYGRTLFSYTNLEDISRDYEDISRKALELGDYEYIEQEYEKILHNPTLEKEKLKRNIWLSNWFVNEIDGIYPLTTKQLRNLYLKIENGLNNDFIEWSKKISNELKFFHWELEFPEVFKKGGFDAVIGNPPWEVLQVKDSEFFAGKNDTIALIRKADERKKAIEKLKVTDPELYNLYTREKQIYKRMGIYIKNNKRFKLTAKGKVNLYQLFAESFLRLTNKNFGIIVPTGLFTDNGNVEYFNYLVDKKIIYEINDFENKGIFRNVHNSYRFSLFISKYSESINYRIFLHKPEELYEKEKIVLFLDDLSLFNPNTKTLPMIKDKNDYRILKKVYESSEIIKNENTSKKNIFKIDTLYNMASDSDKFVRKEELIEQGFKRVWYKYVKDNEEYLPLLEGKNFYILNSRYNEITKDGNGIKITNEKLNDPYYFPETRYYVEKDVFEKTLKEKGFNTEKTYFFGFRDIARSTDARTFIISPLPEFPAGDSINIFETSILVEFLSMSSHIIDFCVRKKIQGIHLNHFIFYQFPIPKPRVFKGYTGINGDETLEESLKKIFVNILNYSYDMEEIVKDLGGEIVPREWNKLERLDNFAKLDAIMAIYYDLTKEELEHVFSDFKIERKNQISEYGEYVSEKLAFKYYDLFKEQIKRR